MGESTARDFMNGGRGLWGSRIPKEEAGGGSQSRGGEDGLALPSLSRLTVPLLPPSPPAASQE